MTQKTLIFFVDAVREDYITKEYTPFLWEMKHKDTYMDVLSLLGYSSGIHPTIWSGLYQERHGSFLVYSYQPEDSPFAWMRHLAFLPTKLRQYLIAALKAPYYMLPWKKIFPKRYKKKILPLPASIDTRMAHCFTNENSAYVPDFFRLLDEAGVSYSSQPDNNNKVYGPGVGVENWTVTDKDVDYYFVYETDPLGHYHGPQSLEMKKKMQHIDAKMAALVAEAQERFGEVNMFVFSDHGMVEVTDTVDVKSVLDASDLVPVEDYVVFYDSTMVRFWVGDEKVRQQIIELVGAIEHVTYLDESLQAEHHIRFDTRKWGDVMFLVDPGYRVFPDYFAPVRFNTKGMHGYWPAAKAGQGVFLTNVFATDHKEISVVDFMPTMLDGMGLADLIPAGIDGQSIISRNQ